MRIKRMTAVLCAAVTAVSAMCAVLPAQLPEVFAEDIPVWDGTYDTSWYTADHLTRTVNGSEWAYYKIGTAEELAGLSYLVRHGNRMENTYIELTNDIKLNDTSNFENWETEPPVNNWTPIGEVPYGSLYEDGGFSVKDSTMYYYFAGVFNGEGHTISGMYCLHDCCAGLFCNVTGGVFRTVVKESYVRAENPRNQTWDTYAGGITAACHQGIINLCEFDGKVSASGLTNFLYSEKRCAAGGICGYFDDTDITDWILASALLAAFGGLWINPALMMSEEVNNPIGEPGIFNCINRGEIYAENCVFAQSGPCAGGIIGFGNLNTCVLNCLSTGKVSTEGDHLYGGIVGRESNFPVKNCYYSNCDKSCSYTVKYPTFFFDDSVNLKDVAKLEKVAERLGVFFEYRDGEIVHDFSPEIPELSAETTTPEQTTTAPVQTTAAEDTSSETTAAATTEDDWLIAPVVPKPELAEEILCDPNCTSFSFTFTFPNNEITGYEFEAAAPFSDSFDDVTVSSRQEDMTVNAGDKKTVSMNNVHMGRTYKFRARFIQKRPVDGKVFYSDWAYQTAKVRNFDLKITDASLTVDREIYLNFGFSGNEDVGSIDWDISEYPDFSKKNYDIITSGGTFVNIGSKGRHWYLRLKGKKEFLERTYETEWTYYEFIIQDDNKTVVINKDPDMEAAIAAMNAQAPAKGDFNDDGAVNLKDAVLLRRFIAGGFDVKLDETKLDLNGDGSVNLKDVVLLRRYIAGGWNVTL